MTSKEFLGTNPFCYKYIIGPFSRCKQEIKWACESSQIVINTHCMTIDELADLINGNVEKEKISGISKAMVYMELLEKFKTDLRYFKGENINVLGTAKQLAQVIDMFRLESGYEALEICNDDKLLDIFTLAKAYEKSGYYDGVQSIVDAINNTSEWAKNQIKNVMIGVFDYDRLSAKEVELLEVVAKELCGTIEKLEYSDTIDEDSYEKNVPKQFMKVYGNNNEIKAVLKDIMRRRRTGEDITFDQVQIITCNDAGFIGMQTFLESLNIPYYMPEGISGKYSFEYSKVAAFLEERKNVCFERTCLASICDELIEKYENKSIYNKLVAQVNNIKKNLPNEFTGRYEDMSNLLLGMLETVRIKDNDKEEGALLISTLSATECVSRKYVYMTGFSSANYNSNSAQLAVLLDDEMSGLSEKYKKYTVAEQDRLNKAKIDRIIFSVNSNVTISYVCFDTVNMREQNPAEFYVKCITLAGVDIKDIPTIGFEANSCDDIITKEEFYLLENDNIPNLKEENYVKQVSPSGTLSATNKGYSASAIETYIKCPYKFLYMYRSRMKDNEIVEPTETQWLDAIEKGNLTHNILEEYVYTKIIEPISGVERVVMDDAGINKGGSSYEALEKMVDAIDADINILQSYNAIDVEAFENIVQEESKKLAAKRPYISEISYETEVLDIKNACEGELKKIYANIINIQNPRIPVAVEFKFEQLDLGNNKIINEGFIDRIDYCPNKGFVIVDYKSSGERGYEEKQTICKLVENEDFQTAQDLVYLLALENGFQRLKDKVYVAEYIFPQLGKTFVPKIWGKSHTDIMASANKIVTTLLKAMTETDLEKFGREIEESQCKFCPYGCFCDFNCSVNNREEY